METVFGVVELGVWLTPSQRVFGALGFHCQVKFKMGFYFFASLFAGLVLLLVALGHVEVTRAPRGAVRDGERFTGLLGRTKAFECLRDLKLGAMCR